MHLYRLQGAATDSRAKAAIQREIDALSAKLDEAFAEADIARKNADIYADRGRKDRRH
jgi:hypothetical protein